MERCKAREEDTKNSQESSRENKQISVTFQLKYSWTVAEWGLEGHKSQSQAYNLL